MLFVGDEEMRELSRQYRKIDKTTDVLSFAMNEGAFGGVNKNILGDVVISVDTAKRQADERGADILSEVTFLLVHGVLHLLGYDHEKDEAGRLRMERKEAEIINGLRP